MNLSMKWLKDFVDIDVAPRQFAEALTMSGSKVECYEYEGAELNNIVIGRVEEIEHHPDADKLFVCQINTGGSENIQIVTGAQNVKKGDIVPVALDNSDVAGGKHIKKGKLRGVVSNGMLCSIAELGLTKNDFPYAVEDGIFIIDEPCEIGQDAKEALGIDDLVVEFEITSNRPDCLSVIGLARETAVTFNKPLKLHAPEVKPGNGDVNELLSVSIEAPDLCYRYCGAVVRNVRIKPSPRWMRERLRASGVRPINNIVDITNYVMLEYGQPMHAFDIRFIDDSKIKVRRAEKGETITTLDGVERELDGNMMVIADANKPVAVAGVMGGEYSGIMDDTATIVFESAGFNGSSVRKTAKRLGMRTDSSARFEKGLDPRGCMDALKRALELVQLLDAGDVVNGIIDEFPTVPETRVVKLEPDWINAFLGIKLDREQMIDILERLGFTVSGDDILVPPFRIDIEHKADIAEEIARIYGYNVIPTTPLRGSAEACATERQIFEKRVNSTMQSLGASEVATFSFISPKYYDKINMPKDCKLRNSLVITNPLGEDTSIMRTVSLPSMCEVLSRNYNNRNPKACLYEISTEYIPTVEGELPDEKQSLIIGMYGENVDFFDLKGIIEKLLETLGISGYETVRAGEEGYSFHPGRSAKIICGEASLGIFGELHPSVCENYGISARCYAAVLNYEEMFSLHNFEKQYSPLPKFPSITRDIAMICNRELPVAELQKAIVQSGGSRLENVALFDVYTGKQIPSDKKSVAFNLTLRSKDSTLTDADADAVMKRVIKALSGMGAELRS
ncbi:MAG: phenylalanine--tRNA ligase subunit beta [Clostridia bacterium]|nr:phenylalanine--tRNA ligase subunit beta [Clostridia bacterium]